MRIINNVRKHVSIEKEIAVDMCAEDLELFLIENVKSLIAEHLEGLLLAAIRRGDDKFEYELNISQLDDTETHWNYKIELDRTHIWSVFGSRGHGA